MEYKLFILQVDLRFIIHSQWDQAKDYWVQQMLKTSGGTSLKQIYLLDRPNLEEGEEPMHPVDIGSFML